MISYDPDKCTLIIVETHDSEECHADVWSTGSFLLCITFSNNMGWQVSYIYVKK